MKKRRFYIGLVLLFIVGLSILLYPTVSNMWNEFRARQLISTYTSNVSGSGIDTASLLEAAREYNSTLKGSAVPDAFSVRDGIKDEDYESLLNIDGDGMMGYIEIPSIDVEVPIYHYTTEEVLKKGAGHLFGSSLPVGGEGTHAVMSAHRGLPSAKLFTDLDLVKEGDVFYIHVLDQILAYQVDQILTVLPEETGALAIEDGKDYVTLVTCTPYAVNSHRLLVRGERIAFNQETYDATVSPTAKPKTESVLIRMLCVLIGIVIAYFIVRFINHKGRKKRKSKTDDGGTEESQKEENTETKNS